MPSPRRVDASAGSGSGGSSSGTSCVSSSVSVSTPSAASSSPPRSPVGSSLSSSTLKPLSAPSKPSSSGLAASPPISVSVTGSGVRRTSSKRVPNGSWTAGWVGRTSRPAVRSSSCNSVTPRRMLSIPKLASRPPSAT